MIILQSDKGLTRRANGETFTKFREVRRRSRQVAENEVQLSTLHHNSQNAGEPPPTIIDYQTENITNFTNSRVLAEWDPKTNGGTAEVVLRIHPKPTTNTTFIYEGLPPVGSGVVVRTEEALIVCVVLLLWVAAIALFFNRWGKIRMLEPYQPKFQQEEQHRKSCPLPEPPPHVHHRSSMSRACGTCNECGYGSQTCSFQFSTHHSLLRPRQNSVFVGSTNAMTLIPESPARRSRSVADLPTLSESPPSLATPTHINLRAPVDVNAYITVSTVTDV